MDQAVDVEVVKEPLDVKQEEGSDSSAFDAGLDSVGHAKDGVRRRVIVPGSELTRGEKVETGSIEENPFGDDPSYDILHLCD